MRMLFFRPERAFGAGTVLVAAAVLLTGCAGKNPLMEEPAARTAAPAPAPAPTAAAPAAQPAARGTAHSDPGVTATGPTGLRRILGALAPYRIDVQQGNFVSREMVDQLREGMTREQVRFVLGTPLLTDLFHANRWDYVFRLQKGSGAVISSRVTVHFQDDRLARIERGELPTEAEYLAFISGGSGLN